MCATWFGRMAPSIPREPDQPRPQSLDRASQIGAASFESIDPEVGMATTNRLLLSRSSTVSDPTSSVDKEIP